MKLYIHLWRFASETGFWFWVAVHDITDALLMKETTR